MNLDVEMKDNVRTQMLVPTRFRGGRQVLQFIV